MRLSIEQLRKLMDWANKEGFDYVEFPQKNPYEPFGYKVTRMKLKEEKKDE